MGATYMSDKNIVEVNGQQSVNIGPRSLPQTLPNSICLSSGSSVKRFIIGPLVTCDVNKRTIEELDNS